MKKYILLGLSLMFFNSSIAQTTSEKIETDFVNYTNLIIDKKIDEAIEYTNPKLFEIFTRTQMKSLLEMVYNMPNIEYKMNLPTNIEVGDIIRIDNIDYAKMNIISPIEMKFKDMEATKENIFLLKANFEIKFGEGNVTYDEKTDFYKINTRKKIIASSTDNGENWKFIVVDNPKMEDILRKIIPAELFE